MALKNLISENKLLILMVGVCKRNEEDLSRYGEGGVELTVYAMTLLHFSCKQRNKSGE